MKRLICVLLCMAVLLAFAACGKSGKESEQETTVKAKTITLEEVKSYAEKGEVLGTPVKLSTTADAIKQMYPASTDEEPESTTKGENSETEATAQTDEHGEEMFLEIYEGDKLTSLMVGGNQYFYLNDDEDEKIAIIVSAGSAYKFKAGISSLDDINFSLGTPDKQDTPANEDLFFMFDKPDNIKRLTYSFGTKRLDFILVDNALAMTVLTDTELYDEFGNSAKATTASSTESNTTTTTEDNEG